MRPAGTQAWRDGDRLSPARPRDPNAPAILEAILSRVDPLPHVVRIAFAAQPAVPEHVRAALLNLAQGGTHT